ncbi:MAG: LpxI family protein [Alphaproteobacteria bacterium]
MSATKEIEPPQQSVGIIAGGGDLPLQLLESCHKKNIIPYVVALKDQCKLELQNYLTEEHFLWANLGAAGRIISFFKSHGVRDIIMIGAVKRPALTRLKPDLKAIQILSRIGFQALGDDGLLKIVKKELEKEGFSIGAIQDYCDRLLMPHGLLGQHKPSKHDEDTITLGVRASQSIGALDIGQSVIVQGGVVIGVEGVEGTDALIKRCTSLLKPGGGAAILVKTCKPQQDMTLDLPTVGPHTVKNAHESGLNGLILHAGHTLLIAPDDVAAYADKQRIFILGVEIDSSSTPILSL